MDIYNIDYNNPNNIVYDTQIKGTISVPTCYNDLLSSTLPQAISYSAGLFKYFFDTKPTPDPDKLDYIEHKPYVETYEWYGWSSSESPQIKDKARYCLKLTSNGDAISIPVKMKVEYEAKNQPEVWNVLINETKQVSLAGYPASQDVYTSEFTIPREATKLRFSYTLDYGVKPSGTKSDGVSAGTMEISLYSPGAPFLNEGTQDMYLYVSEENNGPTIDGVKLVLNGCGIENLVGTTNAWGNASFSINPTYTRDDNLSAYLNITASSSKYNYADASTNILCIDRNPPNILSFGIPKVGSEYAIATWTTDVPSFGKAWHGQEDFESLQEIKNHKIIIKGLNPGTRYSYTIMAWTRYSENYKYAYAHGNFTTRDYNNPPIIMIESPETNTTYKDTCPITYRVEDSEDDPMKVTVLYGKIDGTTIWYELATYTEVYSGITSFIWKTEEVGSGTFKIMVIATDYNETLSTATSGIFTIISPTTITCSASGSDGGQKREEQTSTWVDDLTNCPRCGKKLGVGLKVFQEKTKEEWVVAEIPYGKTFDGSQTVTLGINKGYNPEVTEKGTESCKVRCWVYKDDDYGIWGTDLDEAICRHFYPWYPCSPSDVTFTITVKGYLLNQRKPFDFDYPLVNLIEPSGNRILSDIQEIRWNASTRFRPLRISLFYSKDSGNTWIPIAYNLENTGTYTWDTRNIEDKDGYLIKVLANNGVAASSSLSKGLSICNARFSAQKASVDKNIILPNDTLKLKLGFVDWPKDKEYPVEINFTKPDGSLLWKETNRFSTNKEGPVVFNQEANVPKIDYGGKVDVRIGITEQKGYIALSDGIVQSDSENRCIVARDLLIPKVYLKATPNVTKSDTQIEYFLPEEGTVSVNVYNLWGGKIKSLFSSYQSSGSYSLAWDGKDEKGVIVPDSPYFVEVDEVLKNGYKTSNKTFVLIKSSPSVIQNLKGGGIELSEKEDKIVLTWNSEINKLLVPYGIVPEGYNIYYEGEKIDIISKDDILRYIAGTSTNPKFSLEDNLSLARYEEKRQSKKRHYYGVSFIEGSPTTYIIKPPDWYRPEVSVSIEKKGGGKVIIFFKGEDNVDADSLQYSYSLNNGTWSNCSYRRYVVYENLKSGNYTFSIQAKDSAENYSCINTIYFELDSDPPVIEKIEEIPKIMVPGNLLMLSVIARDNKEVKGVDIDLSSLGGHSNHPMTPQGNGYYWYSYLIPKSISGGTKTIVIKAEDTTRNITTVELTLMIETTPPE
ncbi:MAG: hypothetical protein AB1297_02630, partial [bacterium]